VNLSDFDTHKNIPATVQSAIQHSVPATLQVNASPGLSVTIQSDAQATIRAGYQELNGLLKGNVYHNEPMSRHTSYRIGGPVGLYLECASLRDLSSSFEVLRRYGIPWAVLGKGSNILVADQGWPGAILTFTGQFRKFNFPDRDSENNLVVAGSGVMLSSLVQAAFKGGFSGFEFAVGIPGTLGGALAMNAGTSKEWIGQIVHALTVYRPDHGLRRIARNQLEWGYRTSSLLLEDIIVEAELQVTPGHIGQIRAKMEASLSRRKRTQPLTKPSAGSVFKNPPGEHAAQLIENVGLKGFSIGAAEVSSVHANFIVNNGSATAADVLAIILEIEHRVKDSYGLELQTEIRFIGFDA
jgi:UDP-N-acetylmuramate dehydrogenase